MIFTELVLENFGVYSGRNLIDLRPKNDDSLSPIILIGGMNGGGKTTLIDAIRLALYGQRAQCSTRGNLGYADFLTQSVNIQTSLGKVTQIELSFEHIVEDRWQEFKIIRAWNKYPQDGKDSLSIIVEGNYDNGLAEIWDEYVENLLPLGISNLFLFDGEQVKELAELETPPPTVVDAISTLLGLELAEKLSIDLEVLVSRKRKALANQEQLATLQEIEEQLKQKEHQKETVKTKLQNLEKQLKFAYKEKDRAYNKFRKEGGKIAAERSQLENKIKELNNVAEKEREQLRDLAAGSLPLLLISPLLSEIKSQGEQELKTQQFKQAKNILDERDRKLLDYLNLIALQPQYIDKIKDFIAEENQVLAHYLQEQGKNYLGIDEDNLKLLTTLREERLPQQQKQAKVSLEHIKQLKLEIDNRDTQLAIAASPEDYQKLDRAVQNAHKKVLECQAEIDLVQSNYNNLEREIELIKKELKNYSETIIDRTNDEHIIQAAAKVQQTLNLFREKLILKKLNKLEIEVTECFRYLLHKSNLVHRVAIDSGSFRLSLYDPNGLPLPKQRLSAGEKQLLAVAFLWGLARVSGKNLPIVIDTPLGRLDSSHRHNLVERYFPTASHQVILLSTDTEIGKQEVQQLRESNAIAVEYLLKYDSEQRQTTLETGYFW
ncbi:DNA sulfur modification protein DndD [Stanieria cyanosphaera PCC 7437]|uniref:Nuclease SbcCD subunit C n=1 Tax=Stanieria cyanosphaera (strain ATCC 29371 / PCC 7437) TaxID=111780 RepID=K9XU09_STAC7|nr:DNA sulfur modification protein DndD [Stanieria cyanosphaera]AFZ36043.1 DNA sulfur modification protein DndD [Stanieria cyanosphaera PCC 7437]